MHEETNILDWLLSHVRLKGCHMEMLDYQARKFIEVPDERRRFFDKKNISMQMVMVMVVRERMYKMGHTQTQTPIEAIAYILSRGNSSSVFRWTVVCYLCMFSDQENTKTIHEVFVLDGTRVDEEIETCVNGVVEDSKDAKTTPYVMCVWQRVGPQKRIVLAKSKTKPNGSRNIYLRIFSHSEKLLLVVERKVMAVADLEHPYSNYGLCFVRSERAHTHTKSLKCEAIQ